VSGLVRGLQSGVKNRTQTNAVVALYFSNQPIQFRGGVAMSIVNECIRRVHTINSAPNAKGSSEMTSIFVCVCLYICLPNLMWARLEQLVSSWASGSNP
jgi:hypothetical protein